MRTLVGTLCGLLLAACGGGPALLGSPVLGFSTADLVDVTSPDAIVPLNGPAAVAVSSAPAWLEGETPVLMLHDAPARAYPLPVLIRHQVVNDTLDGRSVLVTMCALSGAAVAFDPVLDRGREAFGTSGKWYRSNLVLYDERSRSLWRQLTGQAVLGPRKGTKLPMRASSVVPFADYVAAQPRGEVIVGLNGVDYGTTPFSGYERRARPFADLYDRVVDARLSAMTRVVGVLTDGQARAYAEPQRQGSVAVVNDRVGSEDVAVVWRWGVRSVARDPSIAASPTIATAAVYSRSVRGRTVRLSPRGAELVDEEGTVWSPGGVALRGPLEGSRLRPVVHVSPYWFAWDAAYPGTLVGGSDR